MRLTILVVILVALAAVGGFQAGRLWEPTIARTYVTGVGIQPMHPWDKISAVTLTLCPPGFQPHTDEGTGITRVTWCEKIPP